MDGDELVELLLRRHDLLRALAEEPRERHVLADALPDSKSTVYKGITQLTEAGLLEDGPDGLRPTLRGTLALARYGELASVADLDLLDAVLGEDVEPGALVGADVVRPDATDAERHLEALWGFLDDATAVEGSLPSSPRATSSGSTSTSPVGCVRVSPPRPTWRHTSRWHTPRRSTASPSWGYSSTRRPRTSRSGRSSPSRRTGRRSPSNPARAGW